MRKSDPIKHQKWMYALSITLFLIFMLNFLEPFSIYNPTYNLHFALLISGYALVGGTIAWCNEWKVVPAIKNHISSLPYRLIVAYGWHLWTASLGIWGYNRLLHAWFPMYHIPAFSYGEALEKTILVGIIPIGIAVMVQYFLRPKTVYADHAMVFLQAQQANDWLKISLDQLLFITSSDNYASIYYLENKKLNRKLLRGSLKHFESQIKNLPIQRCHHSYIVNLNAVSYLEGNTRNLRLYLFHWEQPIPVSRTFASAILQSLEGLKTSFDVSV
ncbi:MAG: LytR/AlgR family response regulator transcription factor [Saprospiraceae bacterium]